MRAPSGLPVELRDLIQYRVLKLVAEVQVLQIRSAQGDDEGDKIQEEQVSPGTLDWSSH